jgi:hypothetical protein
MFKPLALLVRFLVELAMLAALGYWGFEIADGAAQWVLGLGAPLAAAVIWGLFIAPRATYEVSKPVWIGLQVVLFGLAALALSSVASGALVAAFAAVVVLDSAALALLAD